MEEAQDTRYSLHLQKEQVKKAHESDHEIFWENLSTGPWDKFNGP